MLRARADVARGLEADRPGTVRRVARPGTALRERRAGLPGAPPRARRCAVGHGEELRRDLLCGEGARHRGGVLRSLQEGSSAMNDMQQRSVRARVTRPGNPGRLLRTMGIAGVVVALVAPATGAAADPPRPPNIVIILGDDLGFADIGAFGSEIKTPQPRLPRGAGSPLHELLHARELLAHAVDAAERRGHAPQRPGQHGRVDRAQPARRGRVRGLPQRSRRHAAAAAQGRRLPHLHGRQVAHGQGARPDPGRARLRARLLAARRGGQLLGHDELHRPRPRGRSSPRTGAT